MSSERRAEDLTPLQNAVFLLKQTQAKLAANERRPIRAYRRGGHRVSISGSCV